MYSHHTRIYPKRDDVYRAEFPGPYYSTSSVYSYSPTSASDCPEHGRSRKKITVILTTSIILATLGVLSIAGVAAYLGILSNNISNNASQSTVEESYLQSGGEGGGSRLGGGAEGLHPVPTTTEENSELIFTTNDDLLGGLDTMLEGDSLLSGDLTNSISNRISSTPKSSSSSSQQQPPPHRIIEGHHYTPESSSNKISTIVNNNDLHMLHSPHMVTLRPPHDDLREEQNPPVRMFTEPSQTSTLKPVTPRNHRQRYPIANSHSLVPPSSTTTTTTTTVGSTRSDDKVEEEHQLQAEIIHLSNPENAKKPGEIESLLKEDHNVTPSVGSGRTSTSTAATTTSTKASTTTSTTTTTGSTVKSENDNRVSDNHSSRDNQNRRHDAAMKLNSDDSEEEDEEEEDNRSTDYDQSRLDGVSPTMISRLDQQQHPEMPFKPIHPIISSENDYSPGTGDGSTIIPFMGIGGNGGYHSKNGKLPLKFDKVSPEYYDNQPWTPLLDRPNLDKRPRVEVDLGGVGVDSEAKKDGTMPPIFSSTEPIIVWNSEEPEEFGAGSLEYPPRKGLQNFSVPVGGGLHHEDMMYGQGANFTVGTYYGYGHDSRGTSKENVANKPGMVMDEPMEYPMDNPVYPPDDEGLDEMMTTPSQKVASPHGPPQIQHQNEDAMNGFRPSNIPAYTILIPHIPNPGNQNLSSPTTNSGGSTSSNSAVPNDRDFVSSHLSPPEDYAAAAVNEKMDRMGVAEDVEEEHHHVTNDKPNNNDKQKVTYNFEAIKTIPVPEDTSEDQDDYPEDSDIDELSETEANGEPKIYRLDPDVDMVPDTLGETTGKMPLLISSSSPSTVSKTTSTTGKTEGTERSSTLEAVTDIGAEVDEDDVGGAGYIDDSFEQKQNELRKLNSSILTPTADTPTNLTTSATTTTTKNYDKEFSPASMELVIGPQEPDLLIKSTTDLIMSTLGSLNLIKTSAKSPPTDEEINEKLRNSDLAPEEAFDLINGAPNISSNVGENAAGSGGPLFPPVRSYVGINQPLRPKPNRSDPLSTNHINKQFRFSSEDNLRGSGGTLPSFPPDLATTHSLQKVLSMMLGTSLPADGPEELRHLSGHPLIKSLLNKQNVTLVVANETGPPAVINIGPSALPTVVPTMRQSPSTTEAYSSTTPSYSHRDPKSFITSTGSHRDSKIDHAQFSMSGEVNHVPVPLITESSSVPSVDLPFHRPSPPSIPHHLTAFPWSSRSPKVTNKVENNNSPVYKFVLKKGQSVEDLLKEIFSNYTTDPSNSEVTHSPGACQTRYDS